MVTRLC